MELYLHIGLPKAGSSSVQALFDRNRKALADGGILVPRLARFDNHNLLAVPFLPNRVPRFLAPRIGRDFARASARALVGWAEITRQVRDHAPKAVVLTGETFANVADHAGLARRLAESLPGLSRITVLAYLRRPSAAWLSMAQQTVKFSSTLPPLVADSPLSALVGYAAIGDVRATPLAAATLVGSELAQDVLSGIKATWLVDAPAKGRANRSVSAEAMLLMQRYRARMHPGRDDRITGDSQMLLAAIQAIEAAPDHAGLFVAPRLRPEIAAWLDAPRPELAELKARFGVDFQIAGLAAPPPEPPCPVRGIADVTDVAEIDPAALARLGGLVVRRAIPWRPGRAPGLLRRRDLARAARGVARL